MVAQSGGGWKRRPRGSLDRGELRNLGTTGSGRRQAESYGVARADRLNGNHPLLVIAMNTSTATVKSAKALSPGEAELIASSTPVDVPCPVCGSRDTRPIATRPLITRPRRIASHAVGSALWCLRTRSSRSTMRRRIPRYQFRPFQRCASRPTGVAGVVHSVADRSSCQRATSAGFRLWRGSSRGDRIERGVGCEGI